MHRHPSTGRQAMAVADDQLAQALADLQRAGTPTGDAVHAVRLHIRKVRALLKLLRPRLREDTYVEARRRLRTLSRRLAAADAASTALETLGRIMAGADAREARPAIDAIRTALRQRAERTATPKRVLGRAELILSAERARIGTWDIDTQKLPIASRLDRSRLRAVQAMERAMARPTARRERAWRRSATALWLHIQLLESDDRELRLLRRRLEALDGCLDESHNVTTLERMLMAEQLASRHDTALALRLLRHYQTQLRARAAAQGQRALRPARRAHARRAASAPVPRTL